MKQAVVALFAGFAALPSAQCFVSRHLRTQSKCPGLGAPCSGHGECNEHSGVCWCRLGWGSTDCATEVPEIYDVKSVSDPALEDMVGKFARVPMYVQENEGDPNNVKFVHYDPVSKGWAISKLNSSCTDDICFFAYANGQSVPPPKGYVYGEPDKHVYYKQLIFDDCDLYKGKEAGYHMSMSYSPDPNVLGITQLAQTRFEELGNFNDRYVLQPRYVHIRTGKYAIMPVNLNSPGKLWYLLGLEGVGPARRWKVISEVKDPSLNRYTIPSAGWAPPGGGPPMKFKLVSTCNDHVSMDVCNSLEDHCRGPAENKNVKWVQACCRDTCNSCVVPADSCKLPKTADGGHMLLQMFNRTK